jgi:hypothetical protein
VAAKRVPPALVVLLAHTSSLALLLVVDLILVKQGLMQQRGTDSGWLGHNLYHRLGQTLPWATASHPLYGLISGLFCGGGVMLLYWSLSFGGMGTSATPRLLWIAGLAGLLDLAGNFLYLAASRIGRVDVSAVLAAFYPAVIIALAAWLLRERASRSQWAGVGLAASAPAWD